jgi:hypothetical protein
MLTKLRLLLRGVQKQLIPGQVQSQRLHPFYGYVPDPWTQSAGEVWSLCTLALYRTTRPCKGGNMVSSDET